MLQQGDNDGGRYCRKDKIDYKNTEIHNMESQQFKLWNNFCESKEMEYHEAHEDHEEIRK